MDFLEQLFEMYYQKRKAQDDIDTLIGLGITFDELLQLDDLQLRERIKQKKKECSDRIWRIKEKN